MRHIGPQSRLRCSHNLSFQIASLPLGEVSAAVHKERRLVVKDFGGAIHDPEITSD